MSTRNILITSICILTTLASAWLLRAPLAQALDWFSSPQSIQQAVQSCGAWGPLVFFVLFVLQTFLAFIPGQALMLASAYIYGFGWGWLLTWISLVAGGQAAFWLARRCGRGFAERWIAPTVLARWDQAAAGRGVAFFTLALVAPVFPNDAMCYVAGLGRISGRRFFIANLLGRGLASLALSITGAYGASLPPWGWAAAGLAALVLLAAWRLRALPGLAACYTEREPAYRRMRAVLQGYALLLSQGVALSGLEALPPGPKIIAANHTVGSDPLFVLAALPFPVRTLFQDKLFRLPLVGTVLAQTGQVPVQRDTPQARLALEKATELLRQGETILIFPEAQLVPPGQRVRAHTGVVRMALATGAPIIPLGIAVAASDTILLRGGRKSMLWQARGKCRLNFGAAWRPDPLQTDLHQASDALMDQIYTLVDEARAQVPCQDLAPEGKRSTPGAQPFLRQRQVASATTGAH